MTELIHNMIDNHKGSEILWEESLIELLKIYYFTYIGYFKWKLDL